MLILNQELLYAIHGVLVTEVGLKILIFVVVSNHCNLFLVFAWTLMVVTVAVIVIFSLRMSLVWMKSLSENTSL